MEPQAVANAIAQLLAGRSVTFAGIDYTTQVKTAAAHRAVNITKHTVANVQLFANVHSDVYKLAVQRSAEKYANNAENIAEWQTSPTYYTHSEDCYSIVQHKNSPKLYLYCIYNTARSEYRVNGIFALPCEVALYLTPSDAARLLNPPATQHNVTNDVTHNVVVRTIALQNINSITAVRQHITF